LSFADLTRLIFASREMTASGRFRLSDRPMGGAPRVKTCTTGVVERYSQRNAPDHKGVVPLLALAVSVIGLRAFGRRFLSLSFSFAPLHKSV
jgi:hypothetical protein